MILDNKLGIKNELELAKEEEKISKLKVKALFESGFLDTLKAGKFESLKIIHQKLFEDIYDFAGKIRDVNISKGYFRFIPAVYLHEAIKKIELMEQSCFEQIIEKYVEMNIAHPFREGNGRSMRIWLDLILKKELKKVVDWSLIDKDDYIMAMQRSPIKDVEIKILIKNALSDDINSFNVFARGIDASYHYEGYMLYKIKQLY
ncbi:cell filamentation protein [Campylobacter volucris]|uniref:protein adenylyltransferase n=1 Tax=Campylobacter volucris TaxID=1031542 RepID=A0AAE6CYH3_9BACT|nr:cell filamentation protein [Campylobacter volucris]AJC94792.1 Fic domain protein [Campylobacter volucris LMG 24379]KAB0578221.1 cell filamentation protein [Campylobacter volucris]QBL12864.1 cell filamentation protein [Campylobacter volucris]QEL09009.1 Fic domain-containing protein [Campylobacter volucris]TXK66945.1 cell filamentation protein [Campylobacter volucris]